MVHLPRRLMVHLFFNSYVCFEHNLRKSLQLKKKGILTSPSTKTAKKKKTLQQNTRSLCRRRDSRFDTCVLPNWQICSVLNVFFRFILNESLSLTKVFSRFFHLAVLNVEVLVLKLKEINNRKIARGDIWSVSLRLCSLFTTRFVLKFSASKITFFSLVCEGLFNSNSSDNAFHDRRPATKIFVINNGVVGMTCFSGVVITEGLKSTNMRNSPA